MAGIDAHTPLSHWPELMALERTARRAATPCGSGDLIWRRWGDGPAVVLLHGGHGAWNHWLRTIPALSRRFTLWVPDLPGMGDSAMPPAPLTIEHIAQILADGLERLVPARQTLRLVGFSFGATVAGYMLACCGARVERLVLMGSTAGAPVNPASSRMIAWRDAADSGKRRDIHRHNLGTLMFGNPGNIDELAIDLHSHNAERTRLRSRPLHRASDLYAQLGKTPPRRLAALWGAEDALLKGFDAERSRALRAIDPAAEIVIVPGAGHWLQYESAEAANAALAHLL